MVLACVSFVAQGHMAGLGACVRGFDCGAAVRRPAMRLGPCCSTLSRDAATAAVLQLRGGGDDPGRKVRRRKRRHKQKDIFVDDSSARRKHVPVSAQLKRLRGEIKDIKRPEDAPRFVKDSSVGAVEDGAGEHRRTGPGELSSGTGRLQERQVELRHKAWRAKLKRQKEQAFILKKKLERQRLEVKQLQQQYLRPGGALESQQVPMVAGVALQEEFATPLAKHLLPASALTQGRQVGQTSKHTDLEVPEESGTKKSPGAIGVAGPAIPHAPGGHHAAAAAKSAPSMVLDGSDTRDAGRMLPELPARTGKTARRTLMQQYELQQAARAEQREAKLQRREQKRLHAKQERIKWRKKLNARTKRGQPVMRHQIEYILKKLQTPGPSEKQERFLDLE